MTAVDALATADVDFPPFVKPSEGFTFYDFAPLSNGMFQGTCHFCTRVKTSARAGGIHGWFAAHQGADPAYEATCPAMAVTS